MATAANPSIRVMCGGCGWRSQRVRRDPADPSTDTGGFGRCQKCGANRFRRLSARADQKAAKAKAELQALEQGARL